MSTEDFVESTRLDELSPLISRPGTSQQLDQGEQNDENQPEAEPRTRGLSLTKASFFLVAQMAGAGFLGLPKSLANTGGWAGGIMMVFFCFLICFSGTRLAECWVMLEERWEEYRKPSRTPYMDIASRSLGFWGRIFTYVCVLATLFGISSVTMILMSQFINSIYPQFSTCEYILIVAAMFIPISWFGTPKDFWQASIVSIVAVVIACGIILVEVGIEDFEKPKYPNPSFASFSLGFSAILFAFDGAAGFPTIQNDMNDRSQFRKAVAIGYTILLLLYLPVAIAGYVQIGDAVKSNVLLSIGMTNAVTVAIGVQIINLFCSYIITFNPVAQGLEDIFGIENRFGVKRVVLRTTIVLIEVLVGFFVPDFGLIMNLVGGSSITICSFLLPPLMYWKLIRMQDENPNWPKREVPVYEWIIIWAIAFFGFFGGLAATVFASIDIMGPTGKRCFVNFYP